MAQRLLMTMPCLALAALLGACAAPGPGPGPSTLPARLAQEPPAPLLLLGEQHDAPQHQALQAQLVQALAARGVLAALVMEMAEAGHDTRGLPRTASPAAVQEALAWDDRAWPWSAYGPVVMAAVRAGVPVFGGNLPRGRLREAMADASWDQALPPAALEGQRQAVSEGHCGLLPPSQIAPMARVQIARDRSLASSAMQALAPGRTVLLIAGNGHVRSDLGVPQHLPPDQARQVVVARAGSAGPELPADRVWPTPALPERDHCAELREHFKR